MQIVKYQERQRGTEMVQKRKKVLANSNKKNIIETFRMYLRRKSHVDRNCEIFEKSWKPAEPT